mmetsp:Transcript_19692/g.37000  ORF Transcript_19692/g.37000 Transcript_19692/m.37000 type:complete len:216 (+) Transcript_19692:145-792(+)
MSFKDWVEEGAVATSSSDGCASKVSIRLLLPAQLPHLGLCRILQVPGQTKKLQELDGVPGDVDLPPLQPMSAGVFKGMVIVVPAFSECKNSNQPVVHGDVAGVPILKAPHVADGVHSPRHVPRPNGAREEAPQDAWEAAKVVESNNWQHNGVQGIRLLQHSVKPLLSQVLGIGAVHPHPRALLVQEPSGMGPPKAVLGGVDVVGRVRGAMVMAVR